MSALVDPIAASGGHSASPPRTVIRAQHGWAGLDLSALWAYRELLFFLLWRDLKVRYKQTALGAAWVVLQPAGTVLIFTVIFGKFANLPSDGIPYPIYAYCALLPWTLFAGTLNRSGGSLVASANLVSKVYFPRLVIPISAALSGLVDYVISFTVLLVVMGIYGRMPGLAVLTIPFWALMVLLLGLAIGIGLSALNVRYRDVGYLINYLVQVWMYASPVAYSPSIVPAKYRFIYNLNPMVGFIQGTRWALLGKSGPAGVPWIPAVAITLFLLVTCSYAFRRVERSFADTI